MVVVAELLLQPATVVGPCVGEGALDLLGVSGRRRDDRVPVVVLIAKAANQQYDVSNKFCLEFAEVESWSRSFLQTR